MTKFNAYRQSHFRGQVAEIDNMICRQGKGPMVLTLRQARHIWQLATLRAKHDLHL